MSDEFAAPPLVWAGAANPIKDKPIARLAKRTEGRKRIFIWRKPELARFYVKVAIALRDSLDRATERGAAGLGDSLAGQQFIQRLAQIV